jgi:Ran GTPase-activating protein (RanGAP) involved in mRNA processing and transport
MSQPPPNRRPKSLQYSGTFPNNQLPYQLLMTQKGSVDNNDNQPQLQAQQQQQQPLYVTTSHVNSNRFSIASTYDLWNSSSLSDSRRHTGRGTLPLDSLLFSSHLLDGSNDDEGLSTETIQEREQDLIDVLGLENISSDIVSESTEQQKIGNHAAKLNAKHYGKQPEQEQQQQEQRQQQRKSYDFGSVPYLQKGSSSFSQRQTHGNSNSNSSNNNNNNNNVNTSISRTNATNEHYLHKIASSNSHSKKTYRFKNLYTQWCEHYDCIPTQELIRSLKSTIRNQVPFQRLSICHAGIDDRHVKAIVNTLLDIPVNSKGYHISGTDMDTYDVNEILLNHNEITNEGCIVLCKEILNKSHMNAKITSVELFGNKLTDECCEVVSEMLKMNTNLKRLKLGDNNIGSIGAIKLSEGLKLNRTLTQLHLGGNKIQAEGLKAISEALADNKTLTSLGLRDNDVGPEGILHLSEILAKESCVLSDIQLKGNNIGPQGAMHLANALRHNKSLKVLELQSNSIGPSGVRALCSALKENTSVHALNFNDNDLADDGSEPISILLLENPSITTLGLANNRVRKKGASALAHALESQHCAITGLDLGSNEIGNGGAVSLAKALKNNTVLTSLDLRSCEIHLKGILALAEMASVNNTLRHLDLGANYAKNHGAIAWARVLATNKSLTRLCLTDNQIYHEGGEALAIGLQTNYTLRNFSYGGQGVSANRIDSTIRKIIDSIVTENKRHWESINSNNSDSSQELLDTKNGLSAPPVTQYESNNQYRYINVSKVINGSQLQFAPHTNSIAPSLMITSQQIIDSSQTNKFSNRYIAGVDKNNTPGNRNSLPVNFNSLFQQQQQQFIPMQAQENRRLSLNNNANYSSFLPNQVSNLPNWFTSSAHLQVQNQADLALLDSRLEYLFKNQLLKAENPKFKGHFFIGNVINTLRKFFPDIRIDEVGLVQFAYRNPKYYVHLSREMVKTQIKYLGDQANNDMQKQRLQQMHLSDLEDTFYIGSNPITDTRRRPMSLNLNNATGMYPFFSNESSGSLSPQSSSPSRNSGEYSGNLAAINQQSNHHRKSADLSNIYHNRASADLRSGYNSSRSSGEYSNLGIQSMLSNSPLTNGDYLGYQSSSNRSSGDYSDYLNNWSLRHPLFYSDSFERDGFSNLINGHLQQQQQRSSGNYGHLDWSQLPQMPRPQNRLSGEHSQFSDNTFGQQHRLSGDYSQFSSNNNHRPYRSSSGISNNDYTRQS